MKRAGMTQGMVETVMEGLKQGTGGRQAEIMNGSNNSDQGVGWKAGAK